MHLLVAYRQRVIKEAVLEWEKKGFIIGIPALPCLLLLLSANAPVQSHTMRERLWACYCLHVSSPPSQHSIWPAPRSALRSVAPSSEPCILASRYRPRQRRLEFSAVYGQTPRRQDLWRQDVLHWRHESWRQPQGPKMSLSLSGNKYKFSLEKSQIVKN